MNKNKMLGKNKTLDQDNVFKIKIGYFAKL